MAASPPRAASRRAFLKTLAPLAGGMLAACRPARLPEIAPLPAPSALPRPTPPPPEAAPQELFSAGRLTPVADLYRQTYTSPVPVLAPEDWRLAFEGLAEAPYTLTWADLSALPAYDQMQTLECIGNPVGGRLIGNILWTGVSLRDLLAQAQPAAAAQYLVMSSADEYYTSVPLELALDERSLLAIAANGEPLPYAHGFPARVLLPGVYGQKQPKWVTSMRFSDRYVAGTWEREGWSDEARIRINSRIEQPQQGQTLPTGRDALVGGVAFADLSGVAALEVSADGGLTWSPAELLAGPSPMVWTIWHWEWAAPPAGRHVLQARAVDGRGAAQVPAEGVLAGVFPDGTSGIHTVVVEVG